MSLISAWYSTTLAFGTDDQNTPEVNLHDSFEAIEIDIPTLSVAAEVQIKGSNSSGGTFDLIGLEEPIASSTGGFRTTVPLGGKYRYIKVYTSVAQTADAVFAVRGISYASGGLVAVLDKIKDLAIDIATLKAGTGWTFGKPSLRSARNASLNWYKTYTSLFFKGSSGYVVRMYGGDQTGDDWASCYVPVNELLVTDFETALWSYYLSGAGKPYGVNIVIWVHDPNDLSKRAEITQSASTPGLTKENLHNSHALDTSVKQFFWFGENITASGLSSGVATLHSWDDFQADGEFSTYKIYRISMDWGWYNDTNDLGTAYLMELILNGELILLEPQEARIEGVTSIGVKIKRKDGAYGSNFFEGPGKVYWVTLSRKWGSSGVGNVRLIDAIDGTSAGDNTTIELQAKDETMFFPFNPPWQCANGCRYAFNNVNNQMQVVVGYLEDMGHSK